MVAPPPAVPVAEAPEAAPPPAGVVPEAPLPPVLEQALVDFQAERYLSVLEAALPLAEADVRARKLVADSFYNTRRFAEAASHYEKVLKAEPENAAIARYLADAWMQSSDPKRARPLYELLAASNPESSELVLLAGDAARASGDPAGAEASYEKARKMGVPAAEIDQRLRLLTAAGEGTAKAAEPGPKAPKQHKKQGGEW